MRMLILFSHLLFTPAILFAQQKNIHKGIDVVLKEIQAFNEQCRKKDSAANHPLGSYTEDRFAEKYHFYTKANEKLNRINKKDLSFDDHVNLTLLQHEILDNIAEYRYQSYLNPILSDYGFHSSLTGYGNRTIRNKKDAEQYITILKDIPRFVDEHLALMQKGLSIGISQPKIILNGFEATYLNHIVDTIEQSYFWKPFVKRPMAITEADWKILQTNAKEIIENNAINSFKKIKQFFADEYLPKTRTTLSASHFPDGKAFYADRVRHYTTTDLSPEAIYQIGLKEVARIKGEMDKVMQQLNFKGSFKEFITQLRTDTKFYAQTPEGLLKEAAYIAKQVDGKLPSLFGKLPRQPYTVVPVPDHLAPAFTTGRYSGASIKSTRPGEYWVNTYNLPSRTLYTLEALTLHEAVPGHHLQIALTQELDSLPEFRRNLYINAFGEGWGLYSEYLGHEMGFYKDPYSLFGRLTYEMWRACRLVIDVGIHTKDWTREQAVDYLAENTALSMHEVNTEINRYISWPGQALAYKMGEIKIKEMRQKAEDALKEDFDVRAFHDMILSQGTVTLSILEMMTDRFIENQLKNKK